MDTVKPAVPVRWDTGFSLICIIAAKAAGFYFEFYFLAYKIHTFTNFVCFC